MMYQEPQFHIVRTHTEDILTASGGLFAQNNGFNLMGMGGNAGSSWGGSGSSGSTAVEL